MYRSFRARNFRCFAELQVQDIARINLIAGVNNVGKTALLEALLIHAGAPNPELAVHVNAIRGLGVARVQVPGESSIPWTSLFARFATTDPVVLAGEDHDGVLRTIKLRVVEDPAELAKLGQIVPHELGTIDSAHALSPVASALALDYGSDDGESRTCYLLVSTKGYRQVPIPPPPRSQCVYFGARGRYDARADAERFGRMELIGQQDMVRDALRVMEPRLQRLAAVPLAGSVVIHGDIGLGRLVPLPVMGDGMARVFSHLVGIGYAPKGVVLVDEIDNGLHSSVLPRFWRTIAEFARQFDVQVFATTHSFECIEAAHRAFDEELGFEYDFRLHRLDWVNGNIVAKTYDRDALRASLDMGLEVR